MRACSAAEREREPETSTRHPTSLPNWEVGDGKYGIGTPSDPRFVVIVPWPVTPHAGEGRGTAHPCEMKKRLAVSSELTTLPSLD
jgi:hypothetical protein